MSNEDWNLYQKNYLAYLRAFEKKEEILKRLEEIKSDLDRQRKQVYSARLNEFHEKMEMFEERNGYLIEFLKSFRALKVPEGMIARYAQVEKLYSSLEFEKTADEKTDISRNLRQMAETFEEKFQERMSVKQKMDFHKARQAFLTGQLDPATFLQAIVDQGASLGFRANLTPDMKRLLSRRETLGSIQGTKLF